MKKTRFAAALAFGLFLLSSAPVFAAADRERTSDPTRDLSPIQRIVQVIKRLVKPFDSIVIPKP